MKIRLTARGKMIKKMCTIPVMIKFPEPEYRTFTLVRTNGNGTILSTEQITVDIRRYFSQP